MRTLFSTLFVCAIAFAFMAPAPAVAKGKGKKKICKSKGKIKKCRRRYRTCLKKYPCVKKKGRSCIRYRCPGNKLKKRCSLRNCAKWGYVTCALSKKKGCKRYARLCQRRSCPSKVK